MLVNVHEAKTRLSKLLELVEEGETVIIARHGQPVAELIPARRPTGFPFGIARAEPLVSDHRVAPMTDDEAENGSMRGEAPDHAYPRVGSFRSRCARIPCPLGTGQWPFTASVANFWNWLLRLVSPVPWLPIHSHGGRSM